ncbi:ABC transporter substrate-binding protein [Roseiterribacter gracilis]|uniref:ABC transporter substrate-binding protein n=1 Tax=Roseiterribacter gracilis TaxID=2812848 RepID=A0A8S8XI46_9PROT|nr:ABC transporter substrate-binding protein [Rhodospirillales bacterium TMPK1]
MQRRTFLAASAALAFAPSARAAPTTLRVGYIPILPMTPLFVLAGEGWAASQNLELKLAPFSSGPAMVQAMAADSLDIAYVGVGPALVARSRGLPQRVVASCVVDQVALVGRGALARDYDPADPAGSFRRFREREGHAAKIATLPPGSVPDAVLRYWLLRIAKIAPTDVEVIGVGEDAVQQQLLAGAVDAASILEPILTIVQEREPSARVLVKNGELMPGQPGAVVVASENAITQQPDAVKALVMLHARAIAFIHTHTDRTVDHVAQFVGKGLVDPATLKRALQRETPRFVGDPRKILTGTTGLQDFMVELGALSKSTPLEQLFEFRFYDATR